MRRLSTTGSTYLPIKPSSLFFFLEFCERKRINLEVVFGGDGVCGWKGKMAGECGRMLFS